MLQVGDIFNKNTINIFADASVFKTGLIKQDGKEYMITCPGMVAVATNPVEHIIIDNACYVEPGTNNSGEIKAIRLGIMAALKYRDCFQTINLFSDSGICMQGLRTWIKGWVNNQVDGILYSSSGSEVVNQTTFKNIIYDIIQNNLNINLYHQRGHVNINNIDSIKKAKNDFIKFNNLNCDVDLNLITQISYFNNLVDDMTRKHLQAYDNTQPIVYVSPAMSRNNYINKQNMNKYYNLIGGNRYVK